MRNAVARALLLTAMTCAAFVPAGRAAPSCHMELFIHKNGDADLNGTRYAASDGMKLKARVTGYLRRDPACRVDIVTDRDASFMAVGAVIMVMQQAGVAKIGFLTEPRNDP